MNTCIKEKTQVLVKHQKRKTETFNPLFIQSTPEKTNLVIIDPTVDDWEFLIKGVSENAEVFVLNPEQNSIEQIDKFIKNSSKYYDIETLHLISHGTPGHLQLGSTTVNLETLEKNREIIDTWSYYLQDISLVIYGCQVAYGELGKSFLQRLHQLTGAKIAASSTKVGNAEKGGNWQLDYQIGEANSEIIFAKSVLGNYSGVFVPRVSFTVTPEQLVRQDPNQLIATFQFDIVVPRDEEFPANGFEILVSAEELEDLQQYDFTQAEVTGGVFDPTTITSTSTGFSVTAQETLVQIEVPVRPADNDPDTPPSVTTEFGLEESEDYTIISSDSRINNIYDAFRDVPGVVVEPGSDNPIVSFAVSPSQLVQEDPNQRLTTFQFDIGIGPGQTFPTNGLEITFGSDVEGIFELYNFSQGEITNGTLDFGAIDPEASSFSFVATEPSVTINIPVLPDRDPNTSLALEDAEFTVRESENYSIDPSEFNTINIYDTFRTLDGLPPLIDGPTVSFSSTPSLIVKEDPSQSVSTFQFDIGIQPGETFPTDGLEIAFGSDTENIFSQYELSEGTIEGGVLDFDDLNPNASSFRFIAQEESVTITIPVKTPDDDPDTPSGVGVEFGVQQTGTYNINETEFGNVEIFDTFDDAERGLDLLETDIFRFQNSDVPGTFLFVNAEEAASVRANFPNFVEEGLAFQVATEPGDDLLPLYRFQNTVTPGTFIFVGEGERATINADFSDTFNEEGLAFYVYGSGSDRATPLNRFQNTSRPGTFVFAGPEESESIEANFPNFVNEGIAFEVDL